MKFAVTMYRDEDGVYVVDCPSVPGCMSEGATAEAALENIKDAIRLCLEVRREDGLPLTVPVESYEVELPVSA